MPQFDMGVEVIDAVEDFHGALWTRKGEECQGSVACCSPVALAVLVVTGCAGVMDPAIAHYVLPHRLLRVPRLQSGEYVDS
jgi:hypothetical protein